MPLEVGLAIPSRDYHAAHGWPNWYNEPSIILNGQKIPCDAVMTDETGEDVAANEMKVTLTPVGVDQCIRWKGYSNWTNMHVYEPSQQSRLHKFCRDMLSDHGIGLYYVQGDIVSCQIEPVRDPSADPRIIWVALDDAQKDGPLAGSAGVKRIVPDGYDVPRGVLYEFGPMGLKELKAQCKADGHTFPRPYWTEFQRLAHRGELRDVRADAVGTQYDHAGKIK